MPNPLNILKALKSKKRMAITGAGIGAGALLMSGDDEEKSQETQQTPPTLNTTQEPKQEKEEVKAPPLTEDTQIVKSLLGLAQSLQPKLQQLAQEYQIVAQKYMETAQMYEKKVDEILPEMVLFSAKAGFQDITGEDLPRLIGDWFKYQPYGQSLQSVNSLIKGYYVLRLNGVDTEGLNPVDLMVAGENPAFVSNVNEETLKGLEKISNILQLKIKQNLDAVGVAKDLYETKVKMHLDTYNAVNKTVKEVLDYIVDKDKTKLDRWYKEQRIINEKERNEIMREKNTGLFPDFNNLISTPTQE